MCETIRTLCCHERNFELHFVVYKAAYKQVEASMQKKEPKDPKFQEKSLVSKKSEEKLDLAIIKTNPDSPIQEVMCREEHKKLFEGLCKGEKLI
jgi:hypothetical protein